MAYFQKSIHYSYKVMSAFILKPFQTLVSTSGIFLKMVHVSYWKQHFEVCTQYTVQDKDTSWYFLRLQGPLFRWDTSFMGYRILDKSLLLSRKIGEFSTFHLALKP